MLGTTANTKDMNLLDILSPQQSTSAGAKPDQTKVKDNSSENIFDVGDLIEGMT